MYLFDQHISFLSFSKLVESEKHIYSESGQSTTSIRVAAIFVIFFSSALAGILPLIFKVLQNATSWPTRIIRSIGAGVILALSLIHIIPECVESLGHVSSYGSLGGIVVIGGILMVLLLENLASIFVSEGGALCQHGPTPNAASATRPSAFIESPHLAASLVRARNPSNQSAVVEASNLHRGCCTGGDSIVAVQDMKNNATAVTIVRRSAAPAAVAEDEDETGAAAAASENDSRLKVLAFIFELGCVFHSVIVGMDLGVNSSDVKKAQALFVALTFHQALEGISLGTVIVQGKFFGSRGLFMVLAYSITCPVGIIIGMAISTSYNPASLHATISVGVFDGIAGGMLLYVSLVQLIAEDMARLEKGAKSAMQRLVTLLGISLGSAFMAILAIWA